MEKLIRNILISLSLVVSVSGAYAGCWSLYQSELAGCDTLGGFTEIGCNIDATGYYLACVYAAATT